MQITGGNVTIATGATLVQGASVDWSQVLVGNWFIGESVAYYITTVDLINYRLTLSEEYKGSGLSASANYVVVRDFTSARNLPLLNPGDLEAALLFSRAMQIIDPLLGGTAAGEESTIAQTTHGFVAGNVLRYTGGAWVLADATAAPNNQAVCVVSSVVNLNSFKVKTNGIVTGISNITLTANTIYYLRDSTSGGLNLASSAGTTSLPVLFALTSSSGFLLSMGIARPAVFAVGASGLVPNPVSSTGRFLRDDASWQATALGSRDVKSQHCYAAGSLDWVNILTASDLSVLKHLSDLNTRVTALEAMNGGGGITHASTMYTRRDNTSVTTDRADMASPKYGTYVVPAGITQVVITCISGTCFQNERSGGKIVWWSTLASYALRFALTVVPTDTIAIYIGKPRTSYSHTSNVLGASDVIVTHNGTKIVDLVGNMRSGITLDSLLGDGTNFYYRSWDGLSRSVGITDYRVSTTPVEELLGYYNSEDASDWSASVSGAVPASSGGGFTTLTNRFWSGAAILERGAGTIL